MKYLVSSNQVSLPGEAHAAPAPSGLVAPPAKGVIRIEGEALTKRARISAGKVRPQRLGSSKVAAWSGDSHLFWTGAQPDDVLTLKLDQDDLNAGSYDLTLFTTTARDYARIKVAINGQLQESDLYTQQILTGEPLQFRKVNISPSEPLQIDIHITGKNASAVPSYMVGIDRIELAPAK